MLVEIIGSQVLVDEPPAGTLGLGAEPSTPEETGTPGVATAGALPLGLGAEPSTPELTGVLAGGAPAAGVSAGAPGVWVAVTGQMVVETAMVWVTTPSAPEEIRVE